MLTFAFGEQFQIPCALLLGGFDGLHIGHLSLLAEAKKTGLPVVILTLLGGKGKQLFTREERRYVFEKAGIFAVCEAELDDALREMPAEAFADKIFSTIAAKAVFCGEDFRFGKGALGTPELLKRDKTCQIFALPPVNSDGKKLSASLLKELLARGELRMARALSCGYFLQGAVEHGREVGRTYGFPTLNLTPPSEKLLPPDGVFGGTCETPQGTFACILHIGPRPTFGIEEKKVEVYLDGFAGNLYGATVRVYPKAFFRGVMKFPSKEALQRQLEEDIKRLRRGV